MTDPKTNKGAGDTNPPQSQKNEAPQPAYETDAGWARPHPYATQQTYYPSRSSGRAPNWCR